MRNILITILAFLFIVSVGSAITMTPAELKMLTENNFVGGAGVGGPFDNIMENASLENLTDTNILNPLTDECIIYDGTEWINTDCPGGSSATTTVTANQILVGDISNIGVSTSTITILSNTNVGIGSTTPVFKLGVDGTFGVTGAANFGGGITGDLTGNADTATALAANGSNCSAGSYPLGIDASGAVESCTDATTEINSLIATHASVSNAHQDLVTLSGTPNYLTLSGQVITRGTIDISDDTNLTASGNLTLAGDGLSWAAQLVDLSDVSTTTTLANQVLSWNGTNWTNTNIGTLAVTGLLNFFLDDLNSNIAGYDTLALTPSSDAETTQTAVANNGYAAIQEYVTATGTSQVLINGGSWHFVSFVSVSSAAQTSNLVYDVYARDTAGVETLLFTATSTEINDTSVAEHEDDFVRGDFSVNATDRIVVKYRAYTTRSSDTTFTLYLEGNANYSHIHTPIGISHNELAGLQGGSGDERYHMTQSEHSNLHVPVTLAGTPNYITLSGQVLTRNTVDISDDTNLLGGTSLTLSGDTLNVDDNFLANTGDVGTGVYDFGGATSLEGVNGTAPTVNAAGEFAFDTTNDDNLLFYGDELNVLTSYLEKCLTVATTSINTFEDAYIWHPRRAITVQQQVCRVDTGTSQVMNISDGTNDMDSITCLSTLTKDSTLTNNTFTADEGMTIEFGATTGQVGSVNYCIQYTYDRD